MPLYNEPGEYRDKLSASEFVDRIRALAEDIITRCENLGIAEYEHARDIVNATDEEIELAWRLRFHQDIAQAILDRIDAKFMDYATLAWFKQLDARKRKLGSVGLAKSTSSEAI